MTTFVIFWSAIFTVFFFGIGFLVKTLNSIFKAFIDAFLETVKLVFVAGVIMVLLFLTTETVDMIIQQGFMESIALLFFFMFSVGIVIAIFGPLGSIITDLALMCTGYIVDHIDKALDALSNFCTRKYTENLKRILKRLEI